MKKIIKINDNMQKGEYELTQEPGENFDSEFKPELSPKELLELGIFGGKYMTDCTDEFPSDWFEHAKLSPEKKDISLNYYQVDASLSLETWQKKRVDSFSRPARLVSMVLSLLLWSQIT